MTAVGASAEEAVLKLKTRFNELVNTVRAREQQLLQSVVKIKDEKTAALAKQQDDLAHAIARMDVAVGEIRVASKESDVGVLRADADAKGMTVLQQTKLYPDAPVVQVAIPVIFSGDEAVEKNITSYGNVGEPLLSRTVGLKGSRRTLTHTPYGVGMF